MPLTPGATPVIVLSPAFKPFSEIYVLPPTTTLSAFTVPVVIVSPVIFVEPSPFGFFTVIPSLSMIVLPPIVAFSVVSSLPLLLIAVLILEMSPAICSAKP